MPFTKTSLWQSAPFARLVIALAAGILLQWYFQVPVAFWCYGIGVLILSFLAFRFLPTHQQYAHYLWKGVFIHLLICCCGALLVWQNDIRNANNWIGYYNQGNDAVIVTIEEPLVEKNASYKAVCSVHSIIRQNQTLAIEGNLLVYFKKEKPISQLTYGTQIIFKRPLQEIRNSGNPGSFNFKQYSLFNGITHQVYLSTEDYLLLPQKKERWYKTLIFESRAAIVGILRHFINGEKEQGLAEALLIGYKDDLDKRLVQSYSNTGVVHVIAISGLHLGIIYWLLLALTKPLIKFRWWRFLLIAAGLWSFSLLAGAQPSILRSAVMFSTIALSSAINRESSIYNSVALSAFALLCWNPFWLWDVGFQLSYAAVLSIIIFFRPIYNCIYLPNKLVDFFWKLMAVTLAAQLLTLPFILFHFQQFPLVFLFANLVAVPVSSGILLLEIALVIFSFFTPLATLLGKVLLQLIGFLNNYIERLDLVPFATWNGLSITVIQAIVLLIMISFFAHWLLEKHKQSFQAACLCIFLFVLLRSYSFWKADQQQKLIVYNVPKLQAIDVIEGREAFFIGDAQLQQDDFLRNFHLQPSRNLHRLHRPIDLPVQFFSFLGKNILIIDSTYLFRPIHHKIDLLILSHNPKLYLKVLARQMHIAQIVCDGTVPAWKMALWKNDCRELQIPFHNVLENGAFVMQR